MKGLATVLLAVTASSAFMASDGQPATKDRKSPLRTAQVWAPTNIPAMDLKAGPQGPGAFPFLATVRCDYVDKKLSGASPKFACATTEDDELKVKFGGANGEVYAEVAATRLLWALGFGADHMYTVKVVCHGCPAEFGGLLKVDGDRVFDPAVIERKMPGAEVLAGWSWEELDAIDEAAGGATRAQRDALKLMAVFLQHTDNKTAQQRVICRSGTPTEEAPCAKPFMLIQDLGLTFGQANAFNVNATGSMNLVGWSQSPVWNRDPNHCVGYLPKSNTGTLGYPVISEDGRQFLAKLLEQLSDDQIHDLFEAARVTHRVRLPVDAQSGFPTIDEWVAAFKQKRAQITDRRCS